jgi:rhomboid family GlyGly-CTERM serine protease
MSDSTRRTAPAPIRRHKWWFCLAVAFCAILLNCCPQSLPNLRYERAALTSGEEWRALTAHMVHLNAAHLLFNLAGLFLLCELLWADMPLRHGFGLLAWSALGVSAMLWWLHPELAWYAGLSGALHGLWAGCALGAMHNVRTVADAGCKMPTRIMPERHGPVSGRWSGQACVGAVGFALLLVKMASEVFFGVSPGTAQAIGGPVITVAHFYGASSGVVYLLLWKGMRAIRAKH